MPPIIDLSDPKDQTPMTVAIDAMGGDKGPAVAVPATLEYLKSHPSSSAILVGRKEALAPWAAAIGNYGSRLRVVEAKEEVTMHEPVASALRNKKGSSIHVMASLVQSNEAQAAVSAGNTGALMAISRSILKTLPGIERPAIATVLPTIHNSRVYALDLGANMDCSPYQLLQFAWMGSLLAGALEEKSRPTVGLLNVGEEESKGNEMVREAAELFKNSPELNYQGYVEGDAIYQGVVDVVVCDGFVGNVVLKSTEGFARMLANILREEFNRNLYTKICAMLATPTINAFKHRIDPRTYNGAALLGLKGVVVKSHGSADAYSYNFAIHRALAVTRRKLVDHISERLGTPHTANSGP